MNLYRMFNQLAEIPQEGLSPELSEELKRIQEDLGALILTLEASKTHSGQDLRAFIKRLLAKPSEVPGAVGLFDE